MANKQTFEQIIVEYKANDICIGALLASILADGYTIEEAFELYISVMKSVEKDRLIKIVDEEIIEL